MTTRYRVEYHMKSHRRDELIEWIKGLLIVPFVLVRELPSVTGTTPTRVGGRENTVKDRYANVFGDIEGLIDDHIVHQDDDTPEQSKLKMLVPTIGKFFTPLPLRAAFLTTDPKRAISQRRFVAPSFNDIRRLLATAQLLALTTLSTPKTKLKLITFDGDVTLYPDGSILESSNPVIPHLINLLAQDIHIGIVTAAGYPNKHGKEYTRRLSGLLDTISKSSLTSRQKENLAILGGECNYLFRYNGSRNKLEWVEQNIWILEEMKGWKDSDINLLLDIAEDVLNNCVKTMSLNVNIIRKPKAVGLVPVEGEKLMRETLEEAVIATQRTLSNHPVSQRISFCCFNGGSDVWVDVGDKSLGVKVLQRYFHNAIIEEDIEIWGGNTLHVGDQFMSLGGNDFKARKACTTAWIASPSETVALLDELMGYLKEGETQGVAGAVANGN